MKRGSVLVTRPWVKLWGYGATVYSVVTDAEVSAGKGLPIAFYLQGQGSGLYGLTVTSNLRSRTIGNPYNAGVYLAGDGQEVSDNRFEYTGNGVYVTGTNFLVTRNVVYRTWADGITMTHDVRMSRYAGGGRVLCNIVRETGDDMISVVSYGLGAPTVGNILIEGNDVANGYWGRGITVVGGKDITIRSNLIVGTVAAGILVNSEASYKTSNVVNVLVESNQVKEVQTRAPAYNPLGGVIRFPGQGAIDINAQLATQSVSKVLLRNNLIDHPAKDAVFIRNNASDIGVVDNTVRNPGRDGVRIETSKAGETYCSGNILNGTLLAVAQCNAPPPSVSGAQL
jgi:hypothetical protein